MELGPGELSLSPEGSVPSPPQGEKGWCLERHAQREAKATFQNQKQNWIQIINLNKYRKADPSIPPGRVPCISARSWAGEEERSQRQISGRAGPDFMQFAMERI